MIKNEVDSPFQINSPVYIHNFKGRTENIRHILREIYAVPNGNQKHFFITGNDGIGKTSLVKICISYC